jgi:hypothetical protein
LQVNSPGLVLFSSSFVTLSSSTTFFSSLELLSRLSASCPFSLHSTNENHYRV